MTPRERPWDKECYPGVEDMKILAVIAVKGQVTIYELEQITGLLSDVLRVRLARLFYAGLVDREGRFFSLTLDGRRALHLPVESDRRPDWAGVY